jgi:ribosomal protein S6
MILLDNREVKKGWQALKDNVTGLFQKHGAEIVSAKLWDERRLAYPINHQLRGTYLLVYSKGSTGAVDAIRRDLEYAESVLRYMTMSCDDVPESAFEPEAEFDESALRVEEEAAPAIEEPAEAEAEAEAEADTKKSEDTGATGDEDTGDTGDDSEGDDSEGDDSDDAGSDDQESEEDDR